jgi:AraC-like DNA-binding protein
MTDLIESTGTLPYESTGDVPWTFASAQAAAEACGVSKKTILRKAEALEAAGAWRDPKTGAWRITPQQLRDVGLHPGKPRQGPPPQETPAYRAVLGDADAPREMSPPEKTVVDPLTATLLAEYRSLVSGQRVRIAELEAKVAELRQDRDHWRIQHAVAETLANERIPAADVVELVGYLRPRKFWQVWQRQLGMGPSE